MSAEMPSHRAFRIPRAHDDRVQPRRLIALAATCMSVGVALSALLATKPAARPTREPKGSGSRLRAWQSAAAAPELPELGDVRRAHEVALKASSHAQRSTETSASAATLAPPVTTFERIEVAPARNRAKRARATLVRRSVSYQCDPAGRGEVEVGACKRDRALEARIWRVLERLDACRAASDAPGYAELKLGLAPSATTKVVFAASAISPSLNLRAVSQCVAADLSKLRATRRTDRFELRLSFGWRPRNSASAAKPLKD